MDKNQRAGYSERLRSIIASRGLTQQRVADVLGVEQSAVFQWLSRGSIPGRERLRKLCALLRANESWLLRGEGERDSVTVDSESLPKDLRTELDVIGRAAMKSADVRAIVGGIAKAVGKIS